MTDEQFSKEYRSPDVLNAQIDDPDGYYCGICEEINTFADDCGWFYACQPYVAHCRSCWNDHGHTTGER